MHASENVKGTIEIIMVSASRNVLVKVYIELLIFQPRIMHLNRSDWFTQSRLSAHIPYLIWRVIEPSVGKLKQFPSDKMAEKSRFCEVSTENIQEMLQYPNLLS